MGKITIIGRVVVVTGSGKGIGKAIAKEFAKNGYSVILNARDQGELKPNNQRNFNRNGWRRK